MSKIIQLLVSVMCAVFCSASFAQGCKYSGAPGWNQSVREVVADCAAEFPSPNNSLVLRFASNGRISIEGKIILFKGRQVEPPATFSWSPRSDAFFINDGEGSGMASTFRLFRIRGSRVYEDKTVQKAAVSLYRRRTRCGFSAVDPNVYGFGWGNGGSEAYLLARGLCTSHVAYRTGSLA